MLVTPRCVPRLFIPGTNVEKIYGECETAEVANKGSLRVEQALSDKNRAAVVVATVER